MTKKTDSSYARNDASDSLNGSGSNNLSTRARPDIILGTSGRRVKRRNFSFLLFGLFALFGLLVFFYFQKSSFVTGSVPFTRSRPLNNVTGDVPDYIKRENEAAQEYGEKVYKALYNYVSESPNHAPIPGSCKFGFRGGEHRVEPPGPFVGACVINGSREWFLVTVGSNNQSSYDFASGKFPSP